MHIFREVRVLKDEDRPVTFQEEGSTRTLVISIYYRAFPDQSDMNDLGMKYSELFQPCEQRAMGILKDIGMNMELLDSCITHVRPSKFPQKLSGTCPVIIYSPALGLDRDMYMYNIEELVKQGSVVITISASHEAMFTILPTGEFVEQSEAMRLIGSTNYPALHHLVSIRKKDIQFLLDYLPALNATDDTFIGCLELDKIIVAGHSLGGIASLEIALQDDRIQACILLDPSMHLFREENMKGGNRPLTLLLQQEASNLEQLIPKLGEELTDKFIEGQERVSRTLAGIGEFIKVHNASHMTFSDLPLFEEDLVLANTTRKTHNIINNAIIRFLEYGGMA
ncbi:alpha/beta hydrolase family protein [Paenibacillus borealis]|uniref:Alpha/beta hydrolase n=1 Tax=Paenibacillus borealis TaxID=160799 RepID=A0A089LCT7_PAEBO|nr:alpha/beta hydrolase [Paenibacillus borealis]AIQ58677.1 hypothetical protein PBOR_18290 [Paenibacillus borealis]